MKHLNKIYLLFFVVLSSCQSNSKNMVGIWYHHGLRQTENLFLNAESWKSAKAGLLSEEKKPSFQNQRGDYYIKFELRKDNTFTEQLLDIKTNVPLDSALKGNWQIKDNHLILNIENKKLNSSYERIFSIEDHNDGKLLLKCIREKVIDHGEIVQDFDLHKKQLKFEALIKEIGRSNTELLAKNMEYADDFWDVRNFGKYQVLTRYVRDEKDVEKYSETLRSVAYGYIWDYVPYYDPISENTSERLVFNKSSKLTIIYKDLKSASGGCGTLAQKRLDLKWDWDKTDNTITINFDDVKEKPFEVLRLFRTDKFKTEKYKILARNEQIMIWEKIN